MTATSRRSSGPRDYEAVLLWSLVGSVLLAVAAVTAIYRVAARLDDVPGTPGNPFLLVLELIAGRRAWPASTGRAAAIVIGPVAVLAAASWLVIRRVRRGRRDVDRAAAKMASPRDLHALTRAGAAATAARLGVPGSPGLPLGRTVAGDQQLYSSWEDVCVDIWGPRTGKTTSRAIPAILDAPGAVLATSNKRDLVDATRGPRHSAGSRVWVFDPQALAGEDPAWWWNPLTYVTDEVKASILADVFTVAGRDPGARTDAFFDSAATELLAGLLLAAALDSRPITQVYLWLTDPADDEPVLILRQHGIPLSAAAVAGVINAPEKQRGGVYGTAAQIASFLTNRDAIRWVTPAGPGDRRAQLDPHQFVASTDTLYSLSKEGRGSAGPLVTALTVAITEAAEDLAKRSPGGRLPTPLVAVLDEAANVCRWRELPNLYSHYGSRGISLMTILQSWSQGAEVWGRDGMRKLWSAANIKVYGGGDSEAEFLGELSQLIGDYDLDSRSITYGRGQRSSTTSTRRERVLDVADLAAMPRGRAVVFASGSPPTLIRTIPWMTGPHAGAVRASIAAHDPAAQATLAQAAESLTVVQAAQDHQPSTITHRPGGRP